MIPPAMTPEPAIEPQAAPLEHSTPAPAFSRHEPSTDADIDAFYDLLENLPPAPPPPTAEVVPFAPAGNFINFYGLKENPFADSVHPDFFFRTDGHAATFRSMTLAVEFRASLGLVTGPSGTGKTLVSQLLLQHFDDPAYRV